MKMSSGGKVSEEEGERMRMTLRIEIREVDISIGNKYNKRAK